MSAQLILGLAILVTLHELGHFLAARAFGIRVEKFYLFFDAWGFKLFSITKGDTEYGIGWFPMGGYVKIAGMVDESLDTDKLAQEPQPWEFRSKPAWQRLVVMLAGVAMNTVLGILIFSYSLLHYKQEFLPLTAVNNGEGIYAYKLGHDLGFQNGDKIIAIDTMTKNIKWQYQAEKLIPSALFVKDGIVYEAKKFVGGKKIYKIFYTHAVNIFAKHYYEKPIIKVADKKGNETFVSRVCYIDMNRYK